MRLRLYVLAALIAFLAVGGVGRAYATSSVAAVAHLGVFYHDQSGAALHNTPAGRAASLASSRVGFAVRLPSAWPHGSRLQALWVMNRHTPRYVILYYGSAQGSIVCQLRESSSRTTASLHWAGAHAVTIAGVHVHERSVRLGGPRAVTELSWASHGVSYDLLGSTATLLSTLAAMVAALR